MRIVEVRQMDRLIRTRSERGLCPGPPPVLLMLLLFVLLLLLPLLPLLPLLTCNLPLPSPASHRC